MNFHLCYNASEDTFPLPRYIKSFYGPFGFPRLPAGRPYITSNFVMSLDGKASFRELRGRTGGHEVSRNVEDRWLMDFLRAHHDAQLMGASTLREEPGKEARKWDFGIDDRRLQTYRRETLKLRQQTVIILTSSGDVDVSLPVFNSPRVRAWLLTSAQGGKNLQSRLKAAGREGEIKIISVGRGKWVDLAAAVKLLRQRHSIRTLLCEGGPTVYGELLRKRLMDEDFRTLALQVLGRSTVPNIERPTTYGDVSYTPETAPWFKLISLHDSLPFHLFLRLRYHGPRTFSRRTVD
ncbi:MAG TPA: dihydrofolate reductase family protein [Candidatus Acidoferrales bacterium]|nr:dihydrofolate reductase family protein [Candidatus Acidoferrales bacterium]